MKNFAYRNNDYIIPNNPCKSWSQYNCNKKPEVINDDRFGGFLLPFITGAVVSAPFWFVVGNNKQQYQNQPLSNILSISTVPSTITKLLSISTFIHIGN